MTRGFALVLAALAGCSLNPPEPLPGTGWSRAPDMSVYAAMDLAGDLARENEVLCLGRNPAAVDARWRERYGGREAARGSAHPPPPRAGGAPPPGGGGGGAPPPPAAAQVGGREPCPEIVDHRWRREYAKLLRVLETRLYPKGYGGAG